MSARIATPMRVAPEERSIASSQLLPGDGFAVLDIQGEWAWGYSLHDHYVGYVAATALTKPIAPTHVVNVREALLFAQADIKSTILGTASLGSRIAGAPSGENFIETDGGFIHRRHLMPVGVVLDDIVTTAEMLLGAPYRWGGRGAGGIDCSGLVQLALGLAGLPCPRDSDQQREAVGSPLADGTTLRRGDILFFPGHVGIMSDERCLLHANAYWMAVTNEPLADVVARLAQAHEQPITARRRLWP